MAPAGPLWVFSGAQCLGSPVGGGWEELERVKAPFVLLGVASDALPGEASAGLLPDPRGHR